MTLEEFTLKGYIQICFSGPRPNSPQLGGYNWDSSKNKAIISMLQAIIIKMVTSKKYNRVDFLCGGALGVDQMAFASCYAIRQTGNYPKLGEIDLAVIYEDFYMNWYSQSDKDRHIRHKEKADHFIIVDTLADYQVAGAQVNQFSGGKIHMHNKYMVDHSDMGIVIWDGVTKENNGYKTGTYDCIEQLQTQQKSIICLNPLDYKVWYMHNGKTTELKVV